MDDRVEEGEGGIGEGVNSDIVSLYPYLDIRQSCG